MLTTIEKLFLSVNQQMITPCINKPNLLLLLDVCQFKIVLKCIFTYGKPYVTKH